MINQNDIPHGMINYTSRDYNSIMKEFWELVPKLTDLWKPEADSDPGVVLGKFLASIADMLGVNLDWLANEIYGPSVSQRKNAEKLFGLIGYTLGWYTAARTEVTFTNSSEDSTYVVDFGFNGSNFATLNAYTDITSQARVITYNILPNTNTYGAQETRSRRTLYTEGIDIFADTDKVTLKPGESVTRVAIEGELRSWSVRVSDVKKNNYIIKLPSQHIDTTAVWIKAKSPNVSTSDYIKTQWTQVSSPAEFIEPEPRFAVTYDNYSNAQIQVSNYLNQLEDYSDNILVVFWIECSGVIGCVSDDVLSDFQPAITKAIDPTVNNFDPEALTISNLSNTKEIPHTYTVTGKSPETAKEAYFNSRNYINTWDSLITVPDYERFLRREAGVDCAFVMDCQKALETNLAIYHDKSLTDEERDHMYIKESDFPLSHNDYFNWREIIDLKENDTKIPFTCNFRTYTAVCYVIDNDFDGVIEYKPHYLTYIPNSTFLEGINDDFRPLQAMSVELEFGHSRIFPWFVVGQIYPHKMVSEEEAKNLVMKVKESLAIYFSPANRSFGQRPTVMEVVNVVETADPNIRYFDAGSLSYPIINYGIPYKNESGEYIIKFDDMSYFNPVSFAKYSDVGDNEDNIRVSPDWIIKKR